MHRAMYFIVMFVVSISVVTSAPQKEKTLCIWATNCPSRTCADGLYCKDNGDWSQCLENPYTATPTCVATVNGEESDQIKWGCESDGDCCNPDAVCTAQKTCAIPCNLVPQEVSGRLWQQLGNDIDGEGRNDNAGINTLSGNGKVVAVASRSAKQVRVFQLDDSNSWEQIGSDIDSALEDFGHTLALSNDGTVLAIGAPGNNPRVQTSTVTGTVQVFKDDGGVWKQLGQDLTGTSIGDYFGGVVSLSGNGDTLAVGAQYFGSTDRGAVKVFALNGNTWEVIGLIKGENGDRFGDKLELSSNGKVLVVGNPNHVDSGLDLGLARAYKYDARAKSWPQLGQDIVGEDTADRAGYGISVSGDGKIVAIGAYNHDGARGHVRIYSFDGKTSLWVKIGDIDGEGPGHLFGVSIDLSFDGKKIAIGADSAEAPGSDYYYDVGSVRVFSYTKRNTWRPLGQELEGEAKQDYFGFPLSISNDGTVLSVGSYNAESGNAGVKDAGHVKVFAFEKNTVCAARWRRTARYYEGWNIIYRKEMYVAQKDTNNNRKNPRPTNKRGKRFFRKVAKAWVATRSYTKGALVLQKGRELYKSIMSNNKNNNPETEEASWELISDNINKGCK